MHGNEIKCAFFLSASSLTSTTPKSTLGARSSNNNPLAPWLGSATETKSVGSINSGSSTPVKDLLNPKKGPDSIPFGTQVLGNQSVYGIGAGISSTDFDNPSILLTTPTTPSPFSSSTSAVLSNEANPLSPYGGGSGGADRDSSGEEDPPIDTEFKRWPGAERGESVGGVGGGGSDGTESWWSSQFERPRESDSSVNSGSSDNNNMWSDKVSSGSDGATANKGGSNSKSGLGVPKGVVTFVPASNGHSDSEIEVDEEKEHKRGSSPGKLHWKDLFVCLWNCCW
jgi:hypothetical protein